MLRLPKLKAGGGIVNLCLSSSVVSAVVIGPPRQERWCSEGSDWLPAFIVAHLPESSEVPKIFVLVSGFFTSYPPLRPILGRLRPTVLIPAPHTKFHVKVRASVYRLLKQLHG